MNKNYGFYTILRCKGTTYVYKKQSFYRFFYQLVRNLQNTSPTTLCTPTRAKNSEQQNLQLPPTKRVRKIQKKFISLPYICGEKKE